jgi:hypothetical protein
MDMQFLDWIYNGAFAVFGYVIRTLWEAVQELKADLAKLREELPREYCIKVDLDKRFDRVESVLDKIWTKLDNKADRHDVSR